MKLGIAGSGPVSPVSARGGSIAGRRGCGVLARRLTVLLGATALGGLLAVQVKPLQAAQLLYDRNGAKGDDGADVVSFGTSVDGETGHAPSEPVTPPAFPANNVDWNAVNQSAFVGTAVGGRGGDGGTVISVEFNFPNPIPNVGLLGGNGGAGHAGGVVDITNTANLTASGLLSHGMNANADGGRGGDGGWAIYVGFSGNGGAGGRGGDGGSASATNSGVIRTSGDLSHGMVITADGGRGGDGGIGGNAVGANKGGGGGGGGNGGTAFGKNDGEIYTVGNGSRGMLVRAAGGVGGDGAFGFGLIVGSGGNGGAATEGGKAEGINSGRIETSGDFAIGMSVQSIGGGGGSGDDGWGFVGSGGSGAPGNHGNEATGTNTGTIITRGVGAIGMLVESVGGGGGDGGGAVGSVALGGDGGGGGRGGSVLGNIGGSITTGADGSGDGAHGILIQSVGGGGGNGGFALGVNPTTPAVGVGGKGGTASEGGTVTVKQAGSGPTVRTNGMSAIGILAQSVGGGGGNGGGAYTFSGTVSVGVGGAGGKGGAGGDVNYNVGHSDVMTSGENSAGIVAQSVGGGGGNGGFALTVAGLATVGVGGSAGEGGNGGTVEMTTGGKVETKRDRSVGIIAQSIGGGGGNGGSSLGGAGAVSVTVGRSGAGAGDGRNVTFDGTQSEVTTHGADSTGILVQSVGGGGGNGGFSIGVAGAVSVGVGGSGGAAGNAGAVEARSNGSVTTEGDRSIGILVQSVGGGGGNGGAVITGSAGATVGVGGSGGGGGNSTGPAEDTVMASFYTDNSVIRTGGADSAGILVQSIGGGGGNGSFVGGFSLAASIGIGGSGGTAGDAGAVKLTDKGGSVTTAKERSSALIAQSIGGGGGNGGGVVDLSGGFNVGIGGKGAGGGSSGTVDVVNAAVLTTGGYLSHGILAQSLGGGGGSGGFSVTLGGPSFALGGSGAAAGGSKKVTVDNSGKIETSGDLSNGIFAQSVGGSGGDGGFALAGGLFAAVGVGGSGGGGGAGGEVEVKNNADITTKGVLSHGILAQSVGGGGGTGGMTGAFAAGVFGAASVAVGGGGGDGNLSSQVTVTHKGDIHVGGVGSKAILAQSVGGSGGNGGSAFSGSVSAGLYASASVGVSVGGSGGDGGNGGKVTVRADGNLWADTAAAGSGGIVAQSIGGGGGNGGRAATLTGSVSNGVNVSLGVTVGGWAGDGGRSDLVIVDTGLNGGGSIVTKGNSAIGILAQSIAGSGGNGGDSWSAAGGYGVNASVNAAVSIGGGGGDGNVSGDVLLNNAMTVTTGGDMSAAIVAQSIGGGGGNGGATNSATGDLGTEGGVNVAVNVGVGGAGGTGNTSGAVDVKNSGDLTTAGDYSSGIVAQSIGGGGGMGGAANAKAFHVGGTSGTSVTANVGIGGKGGSGNDAAMFRLDGDGKVVGAGVHVDNSGVIRTHGFNSIGILAMSVGGGGGGGGSASTDEEIVGGGDEGKTSVGIGAAIALAAGGAGNGGTVSVTNSNLIVTDGQDSYGISANSIGGGGGVGGSSSSGTIGQYAIGGSLGGKGGGGGNGAQVDVFNLASAGIWTKQERSIGIFAQSVGGGGGAGGAGASKGKSDGAEVSVNLSLGGAGNVGGNAGKVNVENSGWIQTDKANSHGILAQSIGGSGGVGGASGTSANDSKVAITLSLGGAGGDGGTSDKVTVKNFESGTILTKGDNSHGIFAQSIGGGGGAGGAGSTENGEAETAVTLYIGGQGGAGSKGGEVRVDNYGSIETLGYISHGIFAQSVGGGGGASGAASGASEADMTIGGGASGLPIPIDLDPDEKSNGGYVEVNNYGEIVTHKDGSYGIFAQSVGGGGGYGGTVTSDAGGAKSVALGLGGKGGNGGDGGDVKVTVSGSIVTYGDRAHGVVAQSIGGGGGVGGDAKGETSNELAIGGLGGKGGNGGNVTVIRTGTITTYGKDSMAIFAQSVGGGGGLGGAGFGRFNNSDDGSAVSFSMFSGTKGDGGIVTIEQDGDIRTTGDRGHGIVAQAVGGGGGAGGSLTQGAAGTGGGIGDAQAASATTKSQVWVEGAEAYAMFGQSSTGQGDAHDVHLGAGGSLLAQGLDSVAAYAESTSNLGYAKGNLTIDLNGRYAIGGSGTGVAIALVGGVDNVVTNNSLTYAMGSSFTYVPAFQTFSLLAADEPFVPENAILESLFDDFSALTATGTSGNDLINNQKTFNGDGSVKTLGRFIGNIDLGGGDNGFHNFADSSMVGLKFVDLGGGTFLNEGLMTNKGIGVLGTLALNGSFNQLSGGDLVTDIDLDNHATDLTNLTGDGDFAGDAPLNFTSIDRLFDRDGYVIATGATITTTMTPTLTHPAVGFDFKTKASGGNLILYSDSPSFEGMINDPASGVTDPGVVQMAQYMDGLENVQALYDSPSELARMINMLRFSQTEEEFGKALTRLTPHYAVHSYEMINRSTDTMLQTARECVALPDTYAYDGRCVWFTVSPQQEYNRDAGPGASSRDDVYKTLSMGAMGEVGGNWSLGGTIGRTEFNSDIRFKGDLLSETTGESWQAYALAKYADERYFADFALGGGTGRFKGERDTTIAQVGYIPGETLAGDYLDEILHAGIGNSVTYTQNASQFAASARFGFTRQMGGLYVQPSLQLDARYLQVSGKESGSVAAFNFGGTSNTYLSATPGLEVGADIALSDIASLRLYAKGGIEFSNKDWKIEGQLKAAEGLGAPPLVLTEKVDSPLYRVGAGVELNGVNGVGLAVRYNGAFGEKVEMNAVSAALKVRF